MLDQIICYSILTGLLCKFDNIIKKFGYKKPYYLIHSIINVVIVYMTYPAVYKLYFDFHNSYDYHINMNSIWLCMSLHIYHLIHYRKKVNIDDYIHHIPTLLVLGYPTLISGYDNAVIGHIVFYLCGLPGGIDYAMLFCVRNDIMNSITEKFINKQLNLYIRCPGAIISTIFIIIYYQYDDVCYNIFNYYIVLLICMFTYLNGIYYSERVISDYSYNYIANYIKF
jgi:hypothetical protein